LRTVHIEYIVGRKVRDAEGKIAGRLEEVHADWRGDDCVVTHYVLAPRGTYVLRQLGFARERDNVVVPWDKLDLSDPKHPRLRCRTADL
jgi:sporulation protein YlmC with PRC-barrel domain